MNITIRQATQADALTIADHNAAMAREIEEIELDRERLLRGVRAVVSDAAKGFYVVAEADGRVVGQLMITFEWSDWRNGTFWWIQSVYVDPGARGCGVYTRLHEWVTAEAETQADVCGIRLYVDKSNHNAQRTYRRLGMTAAVYDMYESDFVLKR
ncbi:MAG TPA: GNAT family N-acetyltransferase [Bryobacterales bacterium]|nr:GNAT family N-acetyltransferase [Bryobacterales bacterium]